MIITVLLLYIVMTQRWRWPSAAALAVTGAFLVVDAAFFGANALKILQGGWLTLAVALAGAAFFGWRAWWLFAIAALVAYSRIYVGSHWPSDVLTSVFLGTGSSLLLLALADALWKRRGAALFPRIHAQHPALFA